MTEGLHGLALASDPTTTTGNSAILTATQFPQAFGLGESWDPQVTNIVGATAGYEARVYHARGVGPTGRGAGLVVLTPNVDLARDPRWGRTEESYGEDPFLIGEMAKSYIAGLHGTDPRYLLAGSLLKHFMANSNEDTRMTSSSNLDDRNLREYYSASFASAVRGGANAMMTAYNQINGVPAAVTPALEVDGDRRMGVPGLLRHRRAGAEQPGHRPALLHQPRSIDRRDRRRRHRRAAAEHDRHLGQERRPGRHAERRRHRRGAAAGAARALPPGRIRSAGDGAL